MPRYYFHIIDGRVEIGTVGTELPNMQAVRSEAVQAAGGILRDTANAEHLSKAAWHMAVADSSKA